MPVYVASSKSEKLFIPLGVCVSEKVSVTVPVDVNGSPVHGFVSSS
jgi:hypothetical protein